MIDLPMRNTMFLPKNKKYRHIILNNESLMLYYFRIKEIAINAIKWENLPDTIDPRMLELTLFEHGKCIYFNDEFLGNLALPTTIGPKLNVYREPIERMAYSVNGYQKQLNINDSVIIWNNYMRTPSELAAINYARRLADIDRTIDVNVRAQKTPVAIVCEEYQRLSLENLYNDYDNNKTVLILSSKNINLNDIKVIDTKAPFVSENLQMIKKQIWAECMTYFGIISNTSEKKERAITGEITSNMGAVEAERFVRLNAREEAANKINKMFGTNISVNYRTEITLNFESSGGDTIE